jgi:hypothetical protein
MSPIEKTFALPGTDLFDFHGELSDAEVSTLAGTPGLRTLQFRELVAPATWPRLERGLFAKRPDVELRAFAYTARAPALSLAFLAEVPSLRRFAVDGYDTVEDLDALGSLDRLESLTIGLEGLTSFDFLERVGPDLRTLEIRKTRSRRPDLSVLGRFPRLRTLRLHGHRKGFEALAGLAGLSDLVLSSMRDPDLHVLADLPDLTSLMVHLGGASDLSGLTRLKRLKHLTLFRIRGVTDLGFLADCASLQFLELDQLTISELPDFRRLTKLRRLRLSDLKRLESWERVAGAPALEHLTGSHGGLSVEAVAAALAAPALRKASVYFESRRDGAEFDALAAARGVSTEVKYEPFEFR